MSHPSFYEQAASTDDVGLSGDQFMNVSESAELMSSHEPSWRHPRPSVSFGVAADSLMPVQAPPEQRSTPMAAASIHSPSGFRSQVSTPGQAAAAQPDAYSPLTLRESAEYQQGDLVGAGPAYAPVGGDRLIAFLQQLSEDICAFVFSFLNSEELFGIRVAAHHARADTLGRIRAQAAAAYPDGAPRPELRRVAVSCIRPYELMDAAATAAARYGVCRLLGQDCDLGRLPVFHSKVRGEPSWCFIRLYRELSRWQRSTGGGTGSEASAESLVRTMQALSQCRTKRIDADSRFPIGCAFSFLREYNEVLLEKYFVLHKVAVQPFRNHALLPDSELSASVLDLGIALFSAVFLQNCVVQEFCNCSAKGHLHRATVVPADALDALHGHTSRDTESPPPHAAAAPPRTGFDALDPTFYVDIEETSGRGGGDGGGSAAQSSMASTTTDQGEYAAKDKQLKADFLQLPSHFKEIGNRTCLMVAACSCICLAVRLASRKSPAEIQSIITMLRDAVAPVLRSHTWQSIDEHILNILGGRHDAPCHMLEVVDTHGGSSRFRAMFTADRSSAVSGADGAAAPDSACPDAHLADVSRRAVQICGKSSALNFSAQMLQVLPTHLQGQILGLVRELLGVAVREVWLLAYPPQVIAAAIILYALFRTVHTRAHPISVPYPGDLLRLQPFDLIPALQYRWISPPDEVLDGLQQLVVNGRVDHTAEAVSCQPSSAATSTREWESTAALSAWTEVSLEYTKEELASASGTQTGRSDAATATMGSHHHHTDSPKAETMLLSMHKCVGATDPGAAERASGTFDSYVARDDLHALRVTAPAELHHLMADCAADEPVDRMDTDRTGMSGSTGYTGYTGYTGFTGFTGVTGETRDTSDGPWGGYRPSSHHAEAPHRPVDRIGSISRSSMPRGPGLSGRRRGEGGGRVADDEAMGDPTLTNSNSCVCGREFLRSVSIAVPELRDVATVVRCMHDINRTYICGSTGIPRMLPCQSAPSGHPGT